MDHLFERMLLPLDGPQLAESAIPYARALTQPAIVIHLLEIVPESYGWFDPLDGVAITPADIRRFDEEAALAYLKTVDQTLRAAGHGFAIRTAVGFGDPAEEN